MPKRKILVINTTVHSTKIAVYDDNKLLFLKNAKHADDELDNFKNTMDQIDYRKKIVLKELEKADVDTSFVLAIVARGGLTKPLKAGVYEVNELMKEDLRIGVQGIHAVNIGPIIADELKKEIPTAKAYIANPVVVDELHDIARISGHPLFERKAVFHALNQKAVARKYARSLNKNYDEVNLIVVHIAEGISVAVHKNGRVIDVNQAFDGEGAFSLVRSGTLPSGDLVDLCFSGKYKKDEIKEMISGKGGLYAYLGTENHKEIEKMVLENKNNEKDIYCAMSYQIAKEIGAMGTVLEGNIDAIILTGDVIYNDRLAKDLTRRISTIGKVVVYAGENELEALAMNGLRQLKGQTEALEYK